MKDDTIPEHVGEVVELLKDLKGERRCFCSMPVHLSACKKIMDWMDEIGKKFPRHTLSVE